MDLQKRLDLKLIIVGWVKRCIPHQCCNHSKLKRCVIVLLT